MSQKVLKRIEDTASDLLDLLQEHPELSGYADNTAGVEALGKFMDELQEIAYHAHLEGRG